MFDFNEVSDTFIRSVQFRFVTEKGAWREGRFDAVFVRQSRDEMKESLEDLRDEKISDIDFVRKIVIGWRGMRDDGQEMEFSETNLDRVIQRLPNVLAALIKTYSDAVNGQKN
jgi:hypothetical protein